MSNRSDSHRTEKIVVGGLILLGLALLTHFLVYYHP